MCQMRLGVTTVKIRNRVRLYLHDEHGLMGVELDHVIGVLDDGTVCALSDDVLDLAFTLSFLKWAIPGPFFVYFWSFHTNINTIFTTNQCEKYPSSIRFWDLNLGPSDCESHPITIRPGLRPAHEVCCRPKMTKLNF